MNTDTKRFLNNPDYVQAIQLLPRLHQLIAQGQGDDAGADEIRDAMEAHWRHLNYAERQRFEGLSADLYMLNDDEIFNRVPPEQRTKAWLEAQILRAVDASDWDTFLALLRNGPDYMPISKLAHFRAIAYARLGHLDIALLFAEYAYRKDASDIDIALNRYSLEHSAGLVSV